jgi:hypothetical protein
MYDSGVDERARWKRQRTSKGKRCVSWVLRRFFRAIEGAVRAVVPGTRFKECAVENSLAHDLSDDSGGSPVETRRDDVAVVSGAREFLRLASKSAAARGGLLLALLESEGAPTCRGTARVQGQIAATAISPPNLGARAVGHSVPADGAVANMRQLPDGHRP